jgi:hypothetical protein
MTKIQLLTLDGTRRVTLAATCHHKKSYCCYDNLFARRNTRKIRHGSGIPTTFHELWRRA